MTVPVVTAAQAGALDTACIASGTPSRVLMQRAGNAAADEIVRRFPDAIKRGVAIFAGPGNNGGDAWVVAGKLSADGVAVRVYEAIAPSTEDAKAARVAAAAGRHFDAPHGNEGVVVDGLLGTGSSGAPRGAIADAVERIALMKSGGAIVVALDVPSGLDASSGVSDGGIIADFTLSFGSAKRGQLLNRASCGRIVVLDIGLGSEGDATLPRLIDDSWVMSHIPPIPADAHKGVRGRIVIAGGALGMTGAVVLAADGAMRSGVGLVRLVVPHESLVVVQSASPNAIAAEWPDSAEEALDIIESWADAVVLGPGLGTGENARDVAAIIARSGSCPIVVDADAINICAKDFGSLTRIAASRKTVVTPHAAEMGRLTGMSVNEILSHRFDVAADLARISGAVVLLKGVPTLIAAPDGRMNVSAAGSPVLAVGGSGDILAGILGTLLAQIDDPFVAASCAAWIHGRAGELAVAGRGVRGRTLAHVLEALSDVWGCQVVHHVSPVIAELPEVAG